MILADLNRTYPALFSLCRFTPHVAAHHFEEWSEDPDAVTGFLRASDLRARIDERLTWARWATTFVATEPRGEAVPHQRRVGSTWRFVAGPLDLGGGRLWVHLFDLLPGALRGEVPTIAGGFRVEAVGIAADLQPLRLPSGRMLDLATGDFGRALIDEREAAEATPDPILRARRVAMAKAISVSGAWGIYARTDRLSAPRPVVFEVEDASGKVRTKRRYPATEVVRAIGPDGEVLAIETDRPERAGPLTLWHLASAIPAACRAVMGITTWDLDRHGIPVAATMTDALAIAAGAEQRGVVHEALARWDKVLHPTGGVAFKIECDSLSRPTVGLISGVNKLLLGRTVDGRVTLVRSSDTGLGDHFLGPTGTDARLPDGRCAWVAELEERLLAHVVATGTVEVPPDLPVWATDRPAMRPGRTRTMADLVRLRELTGDETVQLGARFVTCGGEDGPICLGVSRRPATWQTWPWRWQGEPCRPTVLGDSGAPVEYAGNGPLVVITTMANVLRGWLAERDLTMDRVPGELRRPVPARSHPTLVRLVGRDSTWTGNNDSGPLDYGPLVGEQELLDAAVSLGVASLARAGVPERTAKRIVARRTRPRATTLRQVSGALVQAEKRHCQGPDCPKSLTGRRDRRFCSTACQKAARRLETQRPVPDDVRTAVRTGTATVCPSCGAVLLGAAAADGSCLACGSALQGAA